MPLLLLGVVISAVVGSFSRPSVVTSAVSDSKWVPGAGVSAVYATIVQRSLRSLVCTQVPVCASCVIPVRSIAQRQIGRINAVRDLINARWRKASFFVNLARNVTVQMIQEKETNHKFPH